MWRSSLVAVLIVSAVLQITHAYSRFGQQESHETGVSSNGQSRINDKILSGSNIHFYGRFRNGQDDVLSRYFQRLT